MDFLYKEDFVPGVITKEQFIGACNIMNNLHTVHNINDQKPKLEQFHIAIEKVLKLDGQIKNYNHIFLFYQDQKNKNELENMELLSYYVHSPTTSDTGVIVFESNFENFFLKEKTVCNDKEYYQTDENNQPSGFLLRYIIKTNLIKYIIQQGNSNLEAISQENKDIKKRVDENNQKFKNVALFDNKGNPINKQAILIINALKPLGSTSTNKGGKTKRRRRKRKSSKRKPVKKVKSQKRKKTVKTI